MLPLETFALDPVVGALIAFTFAVNQLSFLLGILPEHFWHWITRRYLIDIDEELSRDVLDFLRQKGYSESGTLRLSSEDRRSVDGSSAVLAAEPYLNFKSNLATLRRQPYHHSCRFRHHNRVFWVVTVTDPISSGGKAKRFLEIGVYSRSLRAIDELIQEARELAASQDVGLMTYHPEPELANHSGLVRWSWPTESAARPPRSVILDERIKTKLLDDINDYLNPVTRRWYQEKGIAWRRGYLLHGPPGTGKTSVSSMIASVFGLNVYTIPMGSRYVDDGALLSLLNNIPSRCVLLLEDIDCAVVERREDTAIVDRLDRTNPGRSATGISLSGLLNAIDGVGAPEGRVLIMTTNYPNHLDPALTRPGRIDMRIEFTKATKAQAERIFVMLYSDSFANEAAEFGKSIPEGELSPADIQEFLLERRDKPDQALTDVGLLVARKKP
jgi:mitochondrial chaperone BCS1